MRYFLLSMFMASADLISKEIVKKKIPVGNKKQISGKLYVWHIKNKGMAYNKLENDRKKVLAASALASGVVGTYLFYLIRKGSGAFEKIGSAMILGGGLGNLADRIKNKEVTDFIYLDFKKAPIFNFADISALIGGLIIVTKSMFD